MGHNISRARQEAQAERQRLARLAQHVVPGWRLELSPERIVPTPDLLGALQRGQKLLYRCERPDCGRRVEPDLDGLVRAGHGHQTPGWLTHLLQCRHPLGCRLKLSAETYPQGVPLVGYLGDPEALIALRCEGCGLTLTRGVEETIARLIATRRGNGATGVLELGQRVRGPCRKCRGRRFASAVVWASERPG